MADLNFSLLAWQRGVLSDTTRFKVVCAGRRCGKSRLAAVTLIIEALQCPKGSSVMYVAPTMGQARVIIWDLLLDLGREVITASHINNLEITMVNGAKIYIRGADNPDALRGLSLTYVVLDEYATIKPMVWEQIIRASLSDKKGRALFIGTPFGRNHFYDIYQLGDAGDDDEWKSWHMTTEDNELIDPLEIEKARKTMSSFAFKQEYMASFDNAGTNIFRSEWVKYGSIEPEGSWFMAIDCAGFESVSSQASASKKRLDQTAIAIVKVSDDGKWWVKNIEYGRWDIRETAVRILKNIREYRPQVGIEKGTMMNAVMPYLTDLMRKNNIYAHIYPLSHGNRNKTDRVVWALQGMFEHGRITLNGTGMKSKDSWQSVFLDEYLMFPTKNVHDDLIDALSMISQMAVTTYRGGEDDDAPEYEPLDVISGI
jgi:phage terminase large subunit-like protein